MHNSVVVYIGRTKLTLKQRRQLGYKGQRVESIYKECDMVLIEETDDVSRERYWIEHYKDTVLNVKKGDGLIYKEYKKKWVEANKEHTKEYMREYYQSNKEKIKEHQREYEKKKYKL